jgi:hypothetical protein
VVRLVERGFYETDTFDFKERLPVPRDPGSRERLVKTCAAFANSAGGFLIFGVRDDRRVPAVQRLVGLEPGLDFPQQFGNFPRQCSPSVEWDFKNPALALETGQVLHIVYIPRSWKAPHACGKAEQGWVFPKRTNQGNDFMSYSEVQSMFLGYYEKRLKLQLLRAELEQIAADARNMIIPPDRNDGTTYNLRTIELRVLETVLSDTYSITHSSPELLGAIAELRSTARIINNKVETFRFEVALPTTNRREVVIHHNDFIRPPCERVVELVRAALPMLDEILR